MRLHLPTNVFKVFEIIISSYFQNAQYADARCLSGARCGHADLLFDPSAVAGGRHAQLDGTGGQQSEQQHGGHVLPHVVVVAGGTEAQHVPQVLKEPSGEREGENQGKKSEAH